jgi:N-methylhydantoinase A
MHQILLVNLRVSSFGVVDKPDLPELDISQGSVERARKGERSVFFEGALWTTPIYERTLLPKDWEIPGPVIVEESGATTVIPPQWSVRTDRFGNLMMDKKA